MAPYDPNEHPFYTIAQSVFGGRQRDEAELERQYALKLERDRKLLQMRQEEADRVADLEAQRLGTAMGAMAPSTTVVNPDPRHPGPVLQQPSIDIPGVTSPLPPMADTVFPGPSRATFGNEALFPQGAPYYPEYPTKTPEQEWRDVYPAAGTASGFTEVPTPPVRPTPPETVSVTTAAGPEAPPSPLPYTPAPFVPGGVRTAVPGMPIDQLLREQPAVGRAYLQNRRAIEEAEAGDVEARGRKATQNYIRARRGGMSEKDAYDQYGEEMEASQAGRNFLTSIGAREEKELARVKAARALERETQAQAWVKQRVAELRDPTGKDAATAQADAVRADIYEAQMLDPKLAENILKMEEDRTKKLEAQAKREEAKKPTIVDGVAYDIVTDPATGERVFKAIPGQRVKAEKPWYEGISKGEALAVANDPKRAPEERKLAQTVADKLQADSEKTAAAGVVKPTPATEKEQRERFVMTEALREARDDVVQHPEWVGGTGAAWTWAHAYDTYDWAKGTAALLTQIPKGYDTFRANLGLFTAQKLNELAGSALTPGEIQRYGAFLPNVYTSRERFMASVEVSLKMMEAATAYQIAREEGKSVPEAQRLAKAAIRRVVNEHVAKYGEPDAPQTGKTLTVPQAAGKLNIPVRP